MKRYAYAIVATVMLVSLVISGCGGLARQEAAKTEEPAGVPAGQGEGYGGLVTEEVVVEKETMPEGSAAILQPGEVTAEPTAEPQQPVAYPTALPTATPGGVLATQEPPAADDTGDEDGGRGGAEESGAAPTPVPNVEEGVSPEEFFQDYGVNPRVDTTQDHLSTFAVDVDTAAYTVMRNYINDRFLPPEASVRVEEYVNFFEQGYEAPDKDAFSINIDGAPSPYAEGYHLVRVGLQGYQVDPEQRDDVVLTFVIDVSGSMDQPNRMPLVKKALIRLVEQLRPTDKVGIVVYGSDARVVLAHEPVDNQDRIRQAIDGLRSEGSTNAEAGLLVGYDLAWRAYDDQVTNRVILCSDGVANVGNTGPDAIMRRIADYANKGVYLTTVGFGMGSYNDTMMEQLADQGDGFYAYVDTMKEAERVFVQDLTSTLQVIARNTKIQVDFNPSVVARYRLLGYENRDVADADFRNDAVDAGEIGPGHSVTALYEIKVQEGAPRAQPAMTVYVRYEDPDSGEVTEVNRSLGVRDLANSFEAATERFQLAVVVSQYAEVLRNSYWAQMAGTTLRPLANEAGRIARTLPWDEDVQEFAQLVERAAELAGE